MFVTGTSMLLRPPERSAGFPNWIKLAMSALGVLPAVLIMRSTCTSTESASVGIGPWVARFRARCSCGRKSMTAPTAVATSLPPFFHKAVTVKVRTCSESLVTSTAGKLRSPIAISAGSPNETPWSPPAEREGTALPPVAADPDVELALADAVALALTMGGRGAALAKALGELLALVPHAASSRLSRATAATRKCMPDQPYRAVLDCQHVRPRQDDCRLQ